MNVSCHETFQSSFVNLIGMLCSSLFLFLVISPLCARRTGGSSVGKSFGGGAHYPRSTGYSGNSQPSHTYPRSTGLSGNNGVDRSTGTRYNNVRYNQKTEVHHHYHYNPPQHISYGSVQHPVYHGTPPVYVYEYRNSGSRYGDLLTGLALYNLGRMSASHDHNHYGSSYNYDSNREYRNRPGEVCKLAISHSNGEYEETRIDCRLISSFTSTSTEKVETTNKITTTVNVTQKVSSDNGTVTTTVQNTTVVDALKVKGSSVRVTPGMKCFIIRMYGNTSAFKNLVDCGLLQEYTRSSMRYNNSNRLLFTSGRYGYYIVLLTFVHVFTYIFIVNNT